MKNFIAEMPIEPEDTLIALGDFNQNATAEKVPKIMEYLTQIDRTGTFTNIRPLILNEYGALIDAMSSEKY